LFLETPLTDAGGMVEALAFEQYETYTQVLGPGTVDAPAAAPEPSSAFFAGTGLLALRVSGIRRRRTANP
jgi:hypothetical protein